MLANCVTSRAGARRIRQRAWEKMLLETVRTARRTYYGWWIVVVAAIFHALFGGLYHTGISVYFLPFQRTFEVSRTTLSLAFALRTLEGGIEGPVVGYLVDKFGPRTVVLVGVIIGALGFLLLALTQSFAMFMVIFLGFLTLGFSSPFHGLTAAINHWFRRHLGTAMSMATVGSAAGGFLITPLVAWIILTQGWRTAAVASGILLLLVGVPLAFLVRKPRGDEAAREEFPATQPLSEAATSSEPAGASADKGDAGRFDGDFTVRQALHTKTYWFLALAIGLRLMAQSALLVHMVPMLVSRGVSEAVAAILVSIVAFVRLPAVVGAGFLSDRWSRQRTASLAMFLGLAGAAVMLFGPAGLITGLAFSFLFAGAQSSNSVTWALVGQFFGRRNFGSLRGGVTLVQSLMSTAGPLGAGLIFDLTESYTIAFGAIAGIYAGATAVFWLLKNPEPPA